MKTVLVTGGKGQLATCIKDLELKFCTIKFIYADSSSLDITNHNALSSFFDAQKIDWCINCAAYTAVDKAEEDKELAKSVNDFGVRNLAQACKAYHTKLIHISTDFVFDGNASIAYTEKDQTNPIGVYGLTKLNGELQIKDILPEHFIIRTSWLYSEHGDNFMKTMLRLAKDREVLSIVSDQIGTPTYAGDLAEIILGIIKTDSTMFGLYHYSNEGVASWYDFAKAIFEISNTKIKTYPIQTKDYPTPAKRPHFSVLNKTKIKENLGVEIHHWRESLYNCLKK